MSGPALPLPFLRLLGVTLAIGQAVALPGVWMFLLDTWDSDSRVADGLAIAGAAVGMACAVALTVGLVTGGAPRRSDALAGIGLALTPLVRCGVAVVLLLGDGVHRFQHGYLAYLSVLVTWLVHGVPAAVLLLSLWRRACLPDWTPHGSSRRGRTLAVVGVMTVAGGAAGVLNALLVIAVVTLFGFAGPDPWAGLMLTPVFHGLGALGGLLCAAWVAPMIRNTDLRRSLPWTVWPALGMATISGLGLPVVGMVLVLPVLLVCAIAVRANFAIHLPGHCTACRYDLREIPGAVCPECGAAVESVGAAA